MVFIMGMNLSNWVQPTEAVLITFREFQSTTELFFIIEFICARFWWLVLAGEPVAVAHCSVMCLHYGSVLIPLVLSNLIGLDPLLRLLGCIIHIIKMRA